MFIRTDLTGTTRFMYKFLRFLAGFLSFRSGNWEDLYKTATKKSGKVIEKHFRSSFRKITG